MIKSYLKTIILLLILSSCKDNKKTEYATIKINFNSEKPIDSLIVYDKEKAWEIKSKLNLNNKTFDTLNISEKKLYTIYSFNNGKQGILSEVILSPNSKTTIHLKQDGAFGDVFYEGTFATPNNLLAFYKKNSDELSNKVKSGIKPSVLDKYIEHKRQVIKDEGITKKVTDSLINYVIDKFDSFASTLKKKNEKYLYKKQLIGKVGNNFNFKDINDHKIKLNKYLGKYLYIDVWATWCKPCKTEAIYLKKLEKDLEGSEEIEIISISIDKDYNKWKEYLSKNQITDNHYYSGAKSEFVKFYDIGSLPRFILIDKEGKIINSDDIRPSNPETLMKLKSLLQIQ